MKPSQRMIPVLVLAAVLGWAGGRLTSEKGDDEGATTERGREPRPSRTPGRAVSNMAAVQSFEELLKKSGSDRRILGALSRQLDSCGEAELSEMLKVLKDGTLNGSWSKRVVAMEMIFERWGELDPDRAMAAAMKLDRWEAGSAIGAIFGTIAEGAPGTVWSMASTTPDGALRKMAQDLALARIAESDPEGAFAYFKETPGLKPHGLFLSWAKLDPEAALAASRTLPGANRNDVAGEVFSQWFKDDQGRALKVYAGLEGLEKRSAGGAILQTWSQKNPIEAAEWAAEHQSELPDHLLGELCSELGKEDPQMAIAWATEHLSDSLRVGALQQVFSEWVARSPSEAVEWVASIEDPAEKMRVASDSFWRLAWDDSSLAASLAKDIGEKNFDSWYIGQMGSNLAELDLQKALEIAEGFETDTFKNQIKSGIVEAWTRVDPDAALGFAMAEENETVRSNLLATIVSEITERDPQKALGLAEGLPEGKEQRQAMSSVIESWTRKSPEDASAYVKGLSDPVVRDAAAGSLLGVWSWIDSEAALRFASTMDASREVENGVRDAASKWAKRDPEAAYEFIKGLPEGGISKKATQAVLASWAGESPEQAALALDGLGGGSASDYKAIAGVWVEKEREAAMVWAEDLGDPVAQAGAFEAITSNWAQNDPIAAGTWVQGLAEGEPRDKAVMAYSKEVLSTDPVSSLGWAASISDDARRWDTVKSLAKTWYGRDESGALEWLGAQGYSDGQIREATRD